MKKQFLSALIIIILIILIFTCSKSSKNQFEPNIQNNKNDMSSMEESKKEKSADIDENKISDKKIEADKRKIIKTGYLTFISEDLKKADDIVNQTVNEYNGYISSLNFAYNSLHIIVRIPANKFDSFIKKSETFSNMNSKKIQTDDVTDKYYDTEARLLTKKKYQEWLRDQYAKAKTIDDLIKFSDKLEEITEDVEAAEGQLRNLTNLTDFSTIDMTFTLPYKPDDKIIFNWPNIKNDLANIFYKIVMMLYATMLVILFIIGIIIVILMIAAVLIPASGLIYYLTFGKIGLVKLFFKKLTGKKT